MHQSNVEYTNVHHQDDNENVSGRHVSTDKLPPLVFMWIWDILSFMTIYDHFFFSSTFKKVLATCRTRSTHNMKTVDISRFQVVKAGVPCQTVHPFKLETIINIMEKNETYIYWLQPPHGGIQQQVACVCINNQYYQLNLKLEKAIFRHIRLCKNFINSEKLADGSQKLRIPQRLLREKLRTSMRSKVSTCLRVVCMCLL
jgi:hypothetical protein